jgi:hypothetical protein
VDAVCSLVEKYSYLDPLDDGAPEKEEQKKKKKSVYLSSGPGNKFL